MNVVEPFSENLLLIFKRKADGKIGKIGGKPQKRAEQIRVYDSGHYCYAQYRVFPSN